MRVGLLTTSFPRFEGDPAGAFVLGFARALASRGHAVEVLAPEPAERIEPPRWPGVDVRWIPYLRPRALERTFYGAGVPDNLMRDPCAWLGPAPFTLSLLREAFSARASWDAIATHWALPSGIVGAIVRERRPHLAVLHSADLYALTATPAAAPLARLIVSGSSALWFVCEAHRERLLALLPPSLRDDARPRCFVSPMGIDPPEPVGARDDLRAQLSLQRHTLLCLGRLVRVKGADVAIEAVAGLRDAELLIAGEGPERTRLERLACERGARVRFLGCVGGTRKHALLAAADALVLPSRRLRSGRTEGVPTTMLEAMAAGLPIVASDVGGIASMIDHDRNGLLVEPERPVDLARGVTRLRCDRELGARMAEAAKADSGRVLWTKIAPVLESALTGGRVASPPAA